MPDVPSFLTPPVNEKAPARPGLFASDGLLARLAAFTLDLVFPPRCAGCGRVDTLWCARCQSDIARSPFILAKRPLPPLTGIAATGSHIGKLQNAVQALKYENGRPLAQPLGDRLYACLRQTKWTIDMIAPVPLHTSRLKERGYNQANLLAQQLSVRSMIPSAPYALIRQHHSRSQVGLTREQRQQNVKDAFSADPAQVAGRTLLIVDDVLTTGSTLAACASAALDAGALLVYGLTVSAARQ